MLKKFALGYTALFVLLLLILLGQIIFGNGSSLTYLLASYSGLGTGMKASFSSSFISNNILPFITIIIASVMLHHDETKLIPRILILVSIGFSFLYIIFYLLTYDLTSMPEFVVKYLAPGFSHVIGVLDSSFIFTIPLLLILAIEPSNRISEILKKASLGSLGLSFLSSMILLMQVYLLTPKTMAAYTSYAKGVAASTKILIAAAFFVLITAALAYVLNYALEGNEKYSGDQEEEETIDYAELARQAEMHAQMRQNSFAVTVQGVSVNPPPAPAQPVAPQQVEEVNVPHVEATPTPVEPSPPADTGLDNLIQSKPLVNESAPQSNE